MNSLPEQFSAARQAQLDNSLKLIRSFSDQALDRTSRVFALQLDASRAAVEQSSAAMRQLLDARDPRDLLALGSQSQQHLRTMLDYGRELFSIATSGMSIPMLRAPGPTAPAASDAAPQQPALPAMVPAAATEVAADAFERIGADTASVSAAAAEAAVEAAAEAAAEDAPPAVQEAASFALPADSAEATPDAVAVVTSDVEPDAAPTLIAKATGEALDAPVAPPHPLAASVPVEVAVEIELPKVEPVDATPPPAAGTTRPTETRGTKGRRKQH